MMVMIFLYQVASSSVITFDLLGLRHPRLFTDNTRTPVVITAAARAEVFLNSDVGRMRRRSGVMVASRKDVRGSMRWTLAAMLATTTSLLLLAVGPAHGSPASHGLDPMPRVPGHKRGGGAVGRKAAMGERSQWEVRICSVGNPGFRNGTSESLEERARETGDRTHRITHTACHPQNNISAS